MKSVSAILLQKNKILRDNIANYLTQAGIQILVRTDSLSDLVLWLKYRPPQIVLLDIELVGERDRELFANLRHNLPNMKFILTGPEPHHYYAEYAKKLGVDMYLSVEANPNQWIKKITTIITQQAISP